jgi:hypothetical protein
MDLCERCGFNGDFVIEEYGESKIIFCPNCYCPTIENCKHEKTSLGELPTHAKGDGLGFKG